MCSLINYVMILTDWFQFGPEICFDSVQNLLFTVHFLLALELLDPFSNFLIAITDNNNSQFASSPSKSKLAIRFSLVSGVGVVEITGSDPGLVLRDFD